MWQKQSNNSSYSDSIKALEADIQHANVLASALPPDYDGHIQMKLSYSSFAPLFLYFVELLDFSCTDALPTHLGLLHILIFNVYVDGIPSMSSKERKATVKEFYTVIYPSLRLLEGEFNVPKNNDQRSSCAEIVRKKRLVKLHDKDKEGEFCRPCGPTRLEGLVSAVAREGYPKEPKKDSEGEEECGICMENSMKMVLPNCGHSLCISCFHDWYMRSESCPFCRGSLRRVTPRDLWVVIGTSDVADRVTVAKENLRCLYLYMETLPPIMQDAHVYTFNYML